MKRFPLDHIGDSQRLTHYFGDRIRYLEATGDWYVFEGTTWRVDNGQVERWAIKTLRELVWTGEYSAYNTDEERFEFEKHIRKTLASPGLLDAMLRRARTAPRMRVTPDELDANPYVLGVANGVIDLRSGELRSYEPADMITKASPVVYDPNATCPTFDAALARVQPDPANREFLQRAAGYTLTGETKEQVLFVCKGPGASGKSTMLNILRMILGPHAKGADAEALFYRQAGTHTQDLAGLMGARFVPVSEIDPSKRVETRVVKQITGEEPITARVMRGDNFEYSPRFKLWVAANSWPRITRDDPAIWRRLVGIWFPVELRVNERDRMLTERLEAEVSGILNWAVTGARAWYDKRQGGEKSGLWPFPPDVTAALDEWTNEADDIVRFINDALVPAPGEFVPNDKMYAAAQEWFADEGLRVPGKNRFGVYLEQHGIARARRAAMRGWADVIIDRDHEGIFTTSESVPSAMNG